MSMGWAAKTSRAAIGSAKFRVSDRPALSDTWPIIATVSAQSRRPLAITSAPACAKATAMA